MKRHLLVLFARYVAAFLCTSAIASCTVNPAIRVDQARLSELPEGAGWHYLQKLPVPAKYASTKCVFENDQHTISSVGVIDYSGIGPNVRVGEVKWRVDKRRAYLKAENDPLYGLFVTIHNKDVRSNWGTENVCTLMIVKDWQGEAGQKQLTDVFSAARNAHLPISCVNMDCADPGATSQ